MPISVTLVDAQDRVLEERMRTAGVRLQHLSAGDLPTLAHPVATPPDIVVVDLRAHPQVPPALAQIRRQHPETGVIIVASTLDPALMLEAMRAGVTECVTDLGAGDLEAAIARLLQHRTTPDAGDVFVFIGAKGGVGTTTVAVNVATALSRLDDSGGVLLVDLHLAGGDAALYLGAEPRFSVIDALENTHRLDVSYFRGLVDRTKAGPDLLASADRAVGMPVDAARVRTLIDFAAHHYKYTVLDIPRSDAAVLDSLESARAIVVVANQELATVRGASRLVSTLKQRYGRDKLSVVLSRSDRRAEISLEDLQRAVGVDVTASFPSDYRLALEALHRGVPIVNDAKSPLAAAFQHYGRELAGITRHTPAEKPAMAQTGLFGRLTGRRA